MNIKKTPPIQSKKKCENNGTTTIFEKYEHEKTMHDKALLKQNWHRK